MPALNLFHRRTMLGGDDLQPTAIFTSVAHVAQFCLLLLPIVLHMNHEAAYILLPRKEGGNGENGGQEEDQVPFLNKVIRYLFGNRNNMNNNERDEFSLYYDNEECNDSAHLFPLLVYTFLLISTIHIIISLFFEYIVYKLSSIGSPTQPELRNPLLGKIVERKVIYISLIGNVTVIGLGISAMVQYAFYAHCREYVIQYRYNDNDANNDNADAILYQDYLSIWFGRHAWWLALILLLASQVVEVSVSSLFLSALLRQEKIGGRGTGHVYGNSIHGQGSADSNHGGDGNDYEMHFIQVQGEERYGHSHSHSHVHHELVEEMWGQRCHAFCKCAASSTCYLFGGRDLVHGGLGDYGQIARALADYFEDGGVLDIVPSDIAAGFMMLQRRQRQKVLAARRKINDEMRGGGGGGGRSVSGASVNSAIGSPAGGGQREDVQLSIAREGSVDSLASFPSGRKRSLSRSSSASRASSMSWDAHNFGHERQDQKIAGSIIFDPSATLNLTLEQGTAFSDLGQTAQMRQMAQIPQYQKQSYEEQQQTDDRLLSILQPMPYTGTLLLPDGPLLSNHDARDFLNTPSAAWTLKKVTEGGEGNYNYQAQKRKVFNRNDAIDTNAIAEGARFARHSLAIYTWYLYVYMNPVIGLPNLIYNRFAEFCGQCISSKKHPKSRDAFNNPSRAEQTSDTPDEESDSFFCNVAHGNTVGDNCFHAHRNGLLAHSGLDESDLIYANFNNKYNQMPYCIVIDHKWQSVVLAIRGTLSLEDCLVDVLVHPDPLDELGMEYDFDGEGQFCHSGVLSCVKYILNDLKRHGILESLLTGIGAPYAHYTLRITGHSLGGGCAALLGYVMRSKFPNLRVVAISPPGGFISWRLATECKDFVTSFVLDSDLVPRLSVHSMEQLRDEVLEMISRIKVPKMQVVRTFILKGILGSHKETIDPEKLAHDNAQILHSKENIPTDTEFYRQMEKFKAIQRQRREKRGEYRNISLFPPGKMVHLVKIDERRSCLQTVAKCVTCCTTNVGYKYTPVYVDNDDFDEITITPTMGFDHFPNRVCVELERVAEAFGIDTSLGSSKHDIENGERLRNANTTIF